MPRAAVPPPRARAARGRPSTSAATAVTAALENAARHHAPIEIGERGLKMRIMFRKRPGCPEVHDEQRRAGRDRRQRHPPGDGRRSVIA